ncbi:MAG: SDR family oxidoreductase [Pseudomonadota bacterium]
MDRGNALVTAAAGGIGLHVARRLVAEGFSVTISDLPDRDGEAAAAEVGASFVACDLRDMASVAETVTALGPLEVLVNNGGIAGPTLPVTETPLADWQEVFDINITAQFVAAKAALPAMIAARSGLIVNMSSVAGRIGYANRSPYAASKWAVLGFTASLAREVGTDGVRVNAILPGAVRGPRIEQVIAAFAEANGLTREAAERHYLERQATGAFIEPEEIASMVAYLASSDARSITGQFISVDGFYQ